MRIVTRASLAVALLLLLSLLLCAAQGLASAVLALPVAPPLPSPLPPLAPLFPAARPFVMNSSSNASLHRYIVVLQANASSANVSTLLASILPANASIHQLFIGPPNPLPPTSSSSSSFLSLSSPSFNAFSAFFTQAQLQQVRASPWVVYVEEDGLISLDYDLTGTQVLSGAPGPTEHGVGISSVGSGNPFYSWGLDRIAGRARHRRGVGREESGHLTLCVVLCCDAAMQGERQLPLTGSYNPTVGARGYGVTVYLIDSQRCSARITGVRPPHLRRC